MRQVADPLRGLPHVREGITPVFVEHKGEQVAMDMVVEEDDGYCD